MFRYEYIDAKSQRTLENKAKHEYSRKLISENTLRQKIGQLLRGGKTTIVN